MGNWLDGVEFDKRLSALSARRTRTRGCAQTGQRLFGALRYSPLAGSECE